MRDAAALADRLGALWSDPQRRRAQGEELLARARERHSQERYLSELLGIYGR
jgi:glycosyltransferase involved in cell wall biosynthesis